MSDSSGVDPTPQPPTDPLQIARSLMLADNLGDVHEVINKLHRIAGISEPEGDFLEGWTDQDYENVGIPIEGDSR